MPKNWIQKAIKNKGAFKRYCGGKVTKACIESGKKSSNPRIRRQAVLAETLMKLRKKRKK